MDALTKSIVVMLVISVVILYLTGTLSNLFFVIVTLALWMFVGYMSGGNEEDAEEAKG